MNDRIMHQDNKIEILGKVFQNFRDVLVIAILCGMTLCECVCQDVMIVNRFGVLIGYKVRCRSVLAGMSMHTDRYNTIMEGNWILGSWRSCRFDIFGRK